MKNVSENIIDINYNSLIDEKYKCPTCDYNTKYINHITVKYKNNTVLTILSEVKDDTKYLISEADLMSWLSGDISLDFLINELKLLAAKRLNSNLTSYMVVKLNNTIVLNLNTRSGRKQFVKYCKYSDDDIFDLVDTYKLSIENVLDMNEQKFNELINKLIAVNISGEILLSIFLSYEDINSSSFANIENYFINSQDSYHLLELYSFANNSINTKAATDKLLELEVDFIEKIINEPIAKLVLYNSQLHMLKKYIEKKY